MLIQAVGIGVLGIKLNSDRNEQAAAPAYRTLSQDTASAPAGSLRVVPASTMKVADWNALLHENHLRVAGGPNDVGAYTLVPTEGALRDRRRSCESLRANPGIRLAEPISAAP